MIKRSAIVPEEASSAEREFVFTIEDFKDIAKRIYQIAGIVLQDHKKDMVYSRLARRLRQLDLQSFAQYRQYLDSPKGAEETQSLVNALTTNLTSFFREPHHFEHLAKVVLPSLRSITDGLKLKVWCSAASTGEEPYSIAATITEVGISPIKDEVRILATDLDTGVLEKARAGTYPRKGLDKMPAQYKKYFRTVDEENVQVTPNLQNLLLFRQLNLLSVWPMKGPFDIIFCRNVLIYFDHDTRKAIIDRMIKLLTPNGILYLGHSESMPNSETRVESEGHTIYRKIPCDNA